MAASPADVLRLWFDCVWNDGDASAMVSTAATNRAADFTGMTIARLQPPAVV